MAQRMPKCTRKPKYYTEDFYTWFVWLQCDSCHMEIRREKAWKVYYQRIYSYDHFAVILCKRCAPTRNLALAYGRKKRSKSAV